MKAIVTVIGKDRVGIIADVSRILAERGVNVLDISQTILQEYFTMVMLVDAGGCTIPFAELTSLLRAEGERLEIKPKLLLQPLRDLSMFRKLPFYIVQKQRTLTVQQYRTKLPSQSGCSVIRFPRLSHL